MADATVSEAAKWLSVREGRNISEDTVRRRIARGQLDAELSPSDGRWIVHLPEYSDPQNADPASAPAGPPAPQWPVADRNAVQQRAYAAYSGKQPAPPAAPQPDLAAELAKACEELDRLRSNADMDADAIAQLQEQEAKLAAKIIQSDARHASEQAQLRIELAETRGKAAEAQAQRDGLREQMGAAEQWRTELLAQVAAQQAQIKEFQTAEHEMRSLLLMAQQAQEQLRAMLAAVPQLQAPAEESDDAPPPAESRPWWRWW